MKAIGLALLALLIPVVVASQTGAVGGRVIDRDSGAPVPDVLVTIDGTDAVLTDVEGYFVIPQAPPGERLLVLEHIAYGTHSRNLDIQAGSEVAIEIVISPRAIELAPLVVESLSELERRHLSTGSSINEIRRPEIEAAARAGLNLSQLIQNTLPGVDVREGRGGQMCVTYRAIRSGLNLGDCDGVSVVLDGVPITSPGYIYTSIPLTDIERLEMLSPGQAGVRYGMRSGQSVLLVETRRGMASRENDLSKLLTGFDWSGEAKPYPWLRVFASAFVTNAMSVGISLALADDCFWTPETSSFALRTRCRALETASVSVLSVALPSASGSIAARWGGRTDRSQGRLVPSMVLTGAVLTGGYLLLINGEGASETAGAMVLGLAVPAVLTLSDRVFRILR
jgi:hypothetical protein